jgi:hypothetical protein
VPYRWSRQRAAHIIGKERRVDRQKRGGGRGGGRIGAAAATVYEARGSGSINGTEESASGVVAAEPRYADRGEVNQEVEKEWYPRQSNWTGQIMAGQVWWIGKALRGRDPSTVA